MIAHNEESETTRGGAAARPNGLQQGVMNHMIPSDEIEEFTWRVAGREMHPRSFCMMLSGSRRRAVYESQDYMEGLNAFLEKRSAFTTGK
jgi:hypothetical protein